jgi:serine/threonine protein kinase
MPSHISRRATELRRIASGLAGESTKYKLIKTIEKGGSNNGIHIFEITPCTESTANNNSKTILFLEKVSTIAQEAAICKALARADYQESIKCIPIFYGFIEDNALYHIYMSYENCDSAFELGRQLCPVNLARNILNLHHRFDRALQDHSLLAERHKIRPIDYKYLKNTLGANASNEYARDVTWLEQKLKAMPIRICHNDLKPENIIIKASDDRAINYIFIDFGSVGFNYQASELHAFAKLSRRSIAGFKFFKKLSRAYGILIDQPRSLVRAAAYLSASYELLSRCGHTKDRHRSFIFAIEAINMMNLAIKEVS